MDLIAFNINSTIDNNQSDNKNLINKTKFQYKIKNI